MQRIVIDGAGKAIPGIHQEVSGKRVSSEELVKSISTDEEELDAEWVNDKLGIEFRHLMSTPDQVTGKPGNLDAIDEIGMAAAATEDAMQMSSQSIKDVDELFYITATHKPYFNQSCKELAERLSLEAADLHEMTVGCGGVGVAITRAKKILAGSNQNVALIVASHAPSKHMNAGLFAKEDEVECEEIFGDGAGALVLSKEQHSDRGLISTYNAVDPSVELMSSGVVDGERLYRLRGPATAKAFVRLMDAAYTNLMDNVQYDLEEIDKLLLHQVNGKIFDQFCKKAFDIDPNESNKIPKHVDRYGNISAASTLVILAEEIEKGRLQRGDLCLFVVMGAGNGAQAASVLFRL